MGLRMTDFKIQTILLLLLLVCTSWVKVNADCTGQVYDACLAEQANDAAQGFGDLLGSLFDADAIDKGKSIMDKKTFRKIGKLLGGFNQLAAVWSLFDFILGGGDSAEQVEMRKRFRETNVKIEQLDNKVDEQTNILVHEIRSVQFKNYWSYFHTLIEAYDILTEYPNHPSKRKILIEADTSGDLSENLKKMELSIGGYIESEIEVYAKCPNSFDGVLWLSAKLARIERAATLGCFLHMEQEKIPKAKGKNYCEENKTGEKIKKILKIMESSLEKSCTEQKALDRALIRMKREDVINSAQSFSATSEKVYKMLNEDFPEYAWLVGVLPGKLQEDYMGIVSPGNKMHRSLGNWKGRNIVIFLITPFYNKWAYTYNKEYPWLNYCNDIEDKVEKLILYKTITSYKVKYGEVSSMRKRLSSYGELISRKVDSRVRMVAYYDKWRQARWKGMQCKFNVRSEGGRYHFYHYNWVWAI